MKTYEPPMAVLTPDGLGEITGKGTVKIGEQEILFYTVIVPQKKEFRVYFSQQERRLTPLPTALGLDQLLSKPVYPVIRQRQTVPKKALVLVRS